MAQKICFFFSLFIDNLISVYETYSGKELFIGHISRNKGFSDFFKKDKMQENEENE